MSVSHEASTDDSTGEEAEVEKFQPSREYAIAITATSQASTHCFTPSGKLQC